MRGRTLLHIVAALLLLTGLAGACSNSYLHQTGSIITVRPNGTDDTDALRCAFERASRRPGTVIQLVRGTYFTDRIVVNHFVGTIRGAGMDATIIRNPNYQIQVDRDDCYLTAPEDGGKYPYLFVLGGGDYTVTDLTVAIVGNQPASDWSIFGIRDWLGHGITSMAGAFVMVGGPTERGYREGNVAFYRVKIKGEHTDDALFGLNIYNAIFIEGFAGASLLPLRGTFSVRNSVFETVGSPFPVLNLTHSRVTMNGNTITDTMWGGELLDVSQTTYEYSHNRVSSAIGVDVYNDCLGSESNCGISDSEIVIRNSDFNTTQGVYLEATFKNGTRALVLGNDFTHVTDTAVYLGAETSHCKVIGTSGGTVVDLGTDNTVIEMAKKHASHHNARKAWWRGTRR